MRKVEKAREKMAAGPRYLETMNLIASNWSPDAKSSYEQLSPKLRVALYCRMIAKLEWNATYQQVLRETPDPDVLPENPTRIDEGIAILSAMVLGNAHFYDLSARLKSVAIDEKLSRYEPEMLDALWNSAKEGNHNAAASLLTYASARSRMDNRRAHTKPAETPMIAPTAVNFIIDSNGNTRMADAPPRVTVASSDET